jgi:hypothetical protein
VAEISDTARTVSKSGRVRQLLHPDRKELGPASTQSRSLAARETCASETALRSSASRSSLISDHFHSGDYGTHYGPEHHPYANDLSVVLDGMTVARRIDQRPRTFPQWQFPVPGNQVPDEQVAADEHCQWHKDSTAMIGGQFGFSTKFPLSGAWCNGWAACHLQQSLPSPRADHSPEFTQTRRTSA